MIISHSKKMIFLRVPKAASTTMGSTLRMSVQFGPEDYLEAIEDSFLPAVNRPVAYEEFINSRVVSAKSIYAKKTQERKGEDVTYSEKEAALIVKTEDHSDFKQKGMSHSTLDDLVDPDSFGDMGVITDAQIREYTTYAAIRNPFKRIISSFLFASQTGRVVLGMDNFHAMINEGFLHLVYRDQWHYHEYQGERVATPILFENLVPEMNSLVTALGGTPLIEIPKFKSRNRRYPVTPSPEEWITPFPKIEATLRARYAKDIALWEEVSGNTL